MKINKKKLQEQINNLQKQLDAMPDERKVRKRWRVSGNDFYFYVKEFGNVGVGTESFGLDDTYRWKLGNYYKTSKEAQKALNKQLAIQRVKDYIIENGMYFEPNWDHCDKSKWFISYLIIPKGRFVVDYIKTEKYVNPLGYLELEDHAIQVIKDCEADLKIVFEIEEGKW